MAPGVRKTADDGRIVITLKCKVPKAERETYEYPKSIDAVDVLRTMIADYDDGKLDIQDLIYNDYVDSIDVEAAK